MFLQAAILLYPHTTEKPSPSLALVSMTGSIIPFVRISSANSSTCFWLKVFLTLYTPISSSVAILASGTFSILLSTFCPLEQLTIGLSVSTYANWCCSSLATILDVVEITKSRPLCGGFDQKTGPASTAASDRGLHERPVFE